MAEQDAAAEEQPAEEPKEEQAADYEAPKEEEAPAQEEEAPKEEEAPAEEPKEEEAPAEEPKEEEAPKEEAPAEEPKEEEAPKEEPKEEAPKEEAKEEPKAEEAKEEPVKKKKKGKKKKKSKAGSGNCEADTMWNEISKKNGAEINWYILKLKGKVGAGEDMECIERGSGGVKEMVTFFTGKEKNIYFGLLRVTTTDNAMSVRAKFVYMKFLGSKVKTMTKAKLTGSLGKIEDKFPCKHLSMDINEKCADDLQPEKLAKELLRVGGAHKPDKMSFGPDQEVDVTNM